MLVESQKFELPESAYDVLEKILRAYAHNPDKELALSEVVSLSGLGRSVVSANHKFLVSAGVLTAGNRKRLTDNGKKLALAISHRIESEVASAWRQIVDDCPQTQTVLKRIDINGGFSQKELPSQVLHALQISGDARRGKTGATCLISIFLKAGALREDGEKYVCDKVSDALPDSDNGEHTVVEADTKIDVVDVPAHSAPAATPLRGRPDPSVHIDVQVHIDANATPEQIDQIFASMAKHLYGRN